MSSAGEPPRKRRRPPLSCEQCRKRKVKCDRKEPCTPCKRFNNMPCTYTVDGRVNAQRMRGQISRQALSTTPLPSTADSDNQHSSLLTLTVPASHPATSNSPDGTRHPRAPSPNPLEFDSVEELKDRILTLQRMLSDALSNGTASESTPSLSSAKRPVPAPSRHKDGSLVKNRFVSSSQWMSFYNEFDTITQYGYSPPTPEIHLLITKCKEIGRLSKAQRPVRFPHLPDFADLVPANDLSDILVHHYLRTFESVYRVLHIPSFREEYNQYKQKPRTATNEFVMKLLLVMAIGTTFYKESHISLSELRTSAISWINAVQEWLAASSEKRLLNINGIQIRCLLLLARPTSAIEGEMLWGSAGYLLRLAMQIGLHRDPKHFNKLSVLEAEVRRRLWTTVLEINLQSSLDSGMPALITLKEFDTGIPSNIDDSDILESLKTHPQSKSISVYTQSSFQIILRKSISLRLEILQVVNDFNREPSYDDVLRISQELTNICHSYKFLEAEISSGDSTSCSTSTFQYNTLDLLIRRFYLPLHRLWCLKARNDPRYYFSRKVLIDTCFAMISYQADPDFLQAITLGRGIFREAIQHPALLICYELISQLEEARTSSSTMRYHRIMREPLHQALHSQIELLTNRIRAGDSNVQGHLFTSMALGQIEAMEACWPIEQGIYDAAKKSLKLTNDILRGRDTFTPQNSVELEQIVTGASPQPADEAFSDTWVLEGVAGYNFWLDDNLTGEAQDLWFSSQSDNTESVFLAGSAAAQGRPAQGHASHPATAAVPGEPAPHARLQGLVRRIAAERPDLFEIQPSHTEGGTADGLYGLKDLPTLNPIARDAAVNHELTHVHPSDNSVYVFLSEPDAKKVTEAGCGQRSAIPVVKGGWIMVYAPRDEAELDLVEEIVRAAAAWIWV
ncbi:hypothetical protein BP5796_13223 [Coleophoma crateriformis]|uniref:Zn(2)-C6 fungal-type domain-containing protein n=1 Tax=Coleophoma crateriformis TaxID=565419 RepID=A0A3D8Q3C6_9HELO|nr:hypothetical protein BP5796_13223 [Coleophoma crateriformis]